ncbi:MAG: hypothetical protein ACE5NP_04945, partial [Anaerolineae bacterium]
PARSDVDSNVSIWYPLEEEANREGASPSPIEWEVIKMVWLEKEGERLIQMPEEWGGIVPSEVFLQEAQDIVKKGEELNLTLRIMGGVGIRLHTMEYEDVARRLGRLGEEKQEFTDLDFMSYKKQRKRMNDLFVDTLGYGWRRPTLSTAASERRIYFHPKGWFFVDVFFDELRVANHPLDFRDRLELDSPTLTATDFLLEKLQIVNFADKDLKDTIILLLAHDVGERDAPETINGRYIAGLLANDWGFWYTLTTNLGGIKQVVPGMSQLSGDEKSKILARLEHLMDLIEQQPKSTKWKLRSRIGTKKRWYEPVETMDTTGGFGIWRLRDEYQKK